MVTYFAGVALASGVAVRFVAPFLPQSGTKLTYHVDLARVPTMQTICASTASVAAEVLIELFLFYNLFIHLVDGPFFCMRLVPVIYEQIFS